MKIGSNLRVKFDKMGQVALFPTTTIQLTENRWIPDPETIDSSSIYMQLTISRICHKETIFRLENLKFCDK